MWEQYPMAIFVNAMQLLDQEIKSTHQHHAYDFKDSFLGLFEEHKKNRVAVFGNYEINS